MNKSKMLKRLRHRFRLPVIRWTFNAFSNLPLKKSHRIGSFIGWLIWFYNGEMRRVSEQNIEACLPELTKPERERLVKKSLIETGKTMAEVPFLWQGQQSKLEEKIRRVYGVEIIEKAIASGKGIVAFAPHLGAWEVAGLYLSKHYPMVTMYKPSHIDGVDDLIQSGRTRFGTKLVATDIKGVKQLLRGLKNGDLVGMLPDQDPGKNGGEFAPFFGIEANSMTLANKILNKSGAVAIFCIAKRLEDGQGYEIQISLADEAISNKNILVALTAMNADLEKVIRTCPEQYQWSYKRFKTRPEGQKKFYH